MRRSTVIAAETDRLARLVGDLLDLAKLDAHRFTLVEEEVDIGRLLEQAYRGSPTRRAGAAIDYTRDRRGAGDRHRRRPRPPDRLEPARERVRAGRPTAAGSGSSLAPANGARRRRVRHRARDPARGARAGLPPVLVRRRAGGPVSGSRSRASSHSARRAARARSRPGAAPASSSSCRASPRAPRLVAAVRSSGAAGQAPPLLEPVATTSRGAPRARARRGRASARAGRAPLDPAPAGHDQVDEERQVLDPRLSLRGDVVLRRSSRRIVCVERPRTSARWRATGRTSARSASLERVRDALGERRLELGGASAASASSCSRARSSAAASSAGSVAAFAAQGEAAPGPARARRRSRGGSCSVRAGWTLRARLRAAARAGRPAPARRDATSRACSSTSGRPASVRHRRFVDLPDELAEATSSS